MSVYIECCTPMCIALEMGRNQQHCKTYGTILIWIFMLKEKQHYAYLHKVMVDPKQLFKIKIQCNNNPSFFENV